VMVWQKQFTMNEVVIIPFLILDFVFWVGKA
jgi:hypothetical protein